MANVEQRQRELADLEARADQLRRELTRESIAAPFQPQGYYAAYYATTGFMLGIFGAMSSLLFNIIGSALTDRNPLELIRVYLTFPLGDKALELTSGLSLAIGCCLYLGTGMLLGIPVYLALTRWSADGPVAKRLFVASVVSLIIWAIMYYGILSWLQPVIVPNMKPENLIVHKVPWYVAALTHLVFGWTLALVYPLGTFTAYRRPLEQV